MDSRTKRFELRLNAHEKEVLKERAAKAGVSVSDLVRLALVYSDRLTVRKGGRDRKWTAGPSVSSFA